MDNMVWCPLCLNKTGLPGLFGPWLCVSVGCNRILCMINQWFDVFELCLDGVWTERIEQCSSWTEKHARQGFKHNIAPNDARYGLYGTIQKPWPSCHLQPKSKVNSGCYDFVQTLLLLYETYEDQNWHSSTQNPPDTMVAGEASRCFQFYHTVLWKLIDFPTLLHHCHEYTA